MNIHNPMRSMLQRIFLSIIFVCVALGCTQKADHALADRLNDISYSYHYRNLDSTRHYALKALAEAEAFGYADGRAEALNNLAFASIAKMHYDVADSLLNEMAAATDNQIELLVGNVQQMRLCQRRSDSKNFYHFRERAKACMDRIREDEHLFSPRQKRRAVYARSEYSVVLSTYLYYIGQRTKSSRVLMEIDPEGPIVKDTAQLLAYYYNVGAGGVLSASSHGELMQSEFEYLMRCYLLSRQYRYVFWEANSLQAISEHLQVRGDRRRLMSDNFQEFDFLNVDQMPDSLLAGNLAQRALALFEQYGDVYQTAGAWRTLSEAYRSICDYQSALVCLENALAKDTVVNAAPDLVASVREQMSMVYSAMDNKPQSDYNRNIYLDMQERTRQDRFLEARAEQLDYSLQQLDVMIVAVILLIVVVVVMLVYFGYWRNKRGVVPSMEVLRQPFEEWRRMCACSYDGIEEEIEEKEENNNVSRRKLERMRERNVEQRAKVWLASTVTPLVGRMLHEVKCLEQKTEDKEVRNSRFTYISQLTDSIDACNRQLTHWIQLRQGDFQLHITSFALAELFASIRQNNESFRMAGITLKVADTEAVVKADRTLTLFMLNTILGNARRYTPKSGAVDVGAEVKDDYVEIYVKDTGKGMTEEQTRNVFKRQVVVDGNNTSVEGGHGFGLVNCKGIIEKYRKLSAIFNVCSIGAESEEGKGSRFFFRLPKGVARVVVALVIAAFGNVCAFGNVADFKMLSAQANAYADSAYYSNVNGSYSLTVAYADSCFQCLNAAYMMLDRAERGKPRLLTLSGDYPAKAAELGWFRDSVGIDFNIILDVRNETAVAALALHRWELYSYNNAVYTQLFRMCSADNTLSSYVRSMQGAESNRNIAIIMLVALLLGVFPAYYLLYYRRRMNYHLYVDRINEVNAILMSADMESAEKLEAIKRVCKNSMAERKYAGKDGFPAEISQLMDGINKAVAGDMEKTAQLLRRKELADEEGRRVQMDIDRLYVSNNVLDNCLSSLKHETMYYPSRLKQLVVDGDNEANVRSLGEITRYYQMLYTTLISQAYNILQGAGSPSAPDFTMHYLFVLLKKKNQGKPLVVKKTALADGYVQMEVEISNRQLCAAVGNTPALLFSPQTPDVDFLICCQIMRDMGEYTGKRGCGIAARVGENGRLRIEIKAVRGAYCPSNA